MQIRQQPIKFDRRVLGSLVSRIEVQKNRLVVSLKPTDHSAAPQLISVTWQKPPSRRSREILLPHRTLRENIRPERAERRARLVTAIARGRRWLDQLSSGAPTRNNWPNASDARCAKSI
jgi:site-specific DNA recombinase